MDKNHPALLLKKISRMHHSMAASMLKKTGAPNRGQSMILMFLMHSAGLPPSQKELAEIIGITPAGVTSSLRSLEAEGFVTKHSDPRDNRRKTVVVTQKGAEHLKRCRLAMDEVSDGLFGGFSPDELAALTQYFTRMLQNLEKMGASPPSETVRWQFDKENI